MDFRVTTLASADFSGRSGPQKASSNLPLLRHSVRTQHAHSRLRGTPARPTPLPRTGTKPVRRTFQSASQGRYPPPLSAPAFTCPGSLLPPLCDGLVPINEFEGLSVQLCSGMSGTSRIMDLSETFVKCSLTSRTRNSGFSASAPAGSTPRVSAGGRG